MSQHRIRYQFSSRQGTGAVDVLQRFLRSAILLLVAAGMFLSCRGADGAPGNSDPGHDLQNQAPIAGAGTVRYIGLEGGFHGIIGDDGKKYLPINLDEQYKVDGLRIRFRLKVRRDVMTIYMWGIPVEVLVIDNIE